MIDRSVAYQLDGKWKVAEAIKEKEKKAIGEMLLILDSALFLRGSKGGDNIGLCRRRGEERKAH